MKGQNKAGAPKGSPRFGGGKRGHSGKVKLSKKGTNKGHKGTGPTI